MWRNNWVVGSEVFPRFRRVFSLLLSCLVAFRRGRQHHLSGRWKHHQAFFLNFAALAVISNTGALNICRVSLSIVLHTFVLVVRIATSHRLLSEIVVFLRQTYIDVVAKSYLRLAIFALSECFEAQTSRRRKKRHLTLDCRAHSRVPDGCFLNYYLHMNFCSFH